MSRLIKTSTTISSLRAKKARLTLQQKQLDRQIRDLSIKATSGAERLLGRATLELIKTDHPIDQVALIASAKSIARSVDRDALLVLTERLTTATGTLGISSSGPPVDEHVGLEEPGVIAPDIAEELFGQSSTGPHRSGYGWSGGIGRPSPAINGEPNNDS